MPYTEIAQWMDAIGSLGAALVALLVVLYFEVHVANKRRREERSALIKAAMDEALLNNDFASHNARRAAKSPSRAFIHHRVSSCIQAFHTGAFDIDEHTRTVVRGYIEGVEHVNSMIRIHELLSLHRPDETESIKEMREAIKRYCSGKMDPEIDKDTKSLPDQIEEFCKELETKFKKELKSRK